MAKLITLSYFKIISTDPSFAYLELYHSLFVQDQCQSFKISNRFTFPMNKNWLQRIIANNLCMHHKQKAKFVSVKPMHVHESWQSRDLVTKLKHKIYLSWNTHKTVILFIYWNVPSNNAWQPTLIKSHFRSTARYVIELYCTSVLVLVSMRNWQMKRKNSQTHANLHSLLFWHQVGHSIHYCKIL